VGVRDFRLFSVKETIPLSAESGMIALDGEREIDFSSKDHAEVTLFSNAFNTINVSACMRYAAKNHHFCS
jgi:NAD+ kinase